MASVVAIGCLNTSSHAPDAAVVPTTLVCESRAATFPTLEKACEVATDCFVALHQQDCCGTEVAIGLARSAEVAFTRTETTCSAGYPGCECAQQPTMAEDGRTNIQGTIDVRCTGGACETYVP
jgi:hypothetical protein